MRSGALFIKYFIVLFAVLLCLSGCSKFNRMLKSNDWKEKYQAALDYYNEKDYYRATVLFEDVLPIIRGTSEGEKAQFYHAYCYYYRDQFILSASYFKTFYDTYNRGNYAVEAYFMYAKSLYMQSPIINLDQTSTREAMANMQLFINRYPTSPLRQEATDLIDEMQKKLEKKGFDGAYIYYRMRRFRAAAIAFDNFSKDFPDSDYVEEALFLQLKCEYRYAQESIASKQKERFLTVVDYYDAFVDKYATSKFLPEAQDIYESSLDKISKLQ